MRWVRSWPATIPAGRAHVVDEMPRLVIADYDYRPLASVQDDVCLLEWDVALDPADARRFERTAGQEPDRVLVAPYRLHLPGEPWAWAHRRVLCDGRHGWVHSGEPTCDYFGFGCIYLPWSLVSRFLRERAGEPLNDETFSKWHREAIARPVAIDWSIRPVHLHG
jgi:hypothetical protein